MTNPPPAPSSRPRTPPPPTGPMGYLNRWRGQLALTGSLLAVVVVAYWLQYAQVTWQFNRWQRTHTPNLYTEIPLNYLVAQALARSNLYRRSANSTQLEQILQGLNTVEVDLGKVQADLDALQQQLGTAPAATSPSPPDPEPADSATSTEAFGGRADPPPAPAASPSPILPLDRELLTRSFSVLNQVLNTVDNTVANLQTQRETQEAIIHSQLCAVLLTATAADQNPGPWHRLEAWISSLNQPTDAVQPDPASLCNSNTASSSSDTNTAQNPTANFTFPSELRDEVVTIILVAGLDASEGEKLRLIQQVNTAFTRGEQSLDKARHYYASMVSSFRLVFPLGLVAGFTLFLISQQGWNKASPYQKNIFITTSASLLLLIQNPLLLQYESNYIANRNAYLNYIRIQNDIRSYLATSYTSNTDISVSTIPDETLVSPRRFIFFIDTRLAAVSSFSIELDPSTLPDYTNLYPYFNLELDEGTDSIPNPEAEAESGTGQ